MNTSLRFSFLRLWSAGPCPGSGQGWDIVSGKGRAGTKGLYLAGCGIHVSKPEELQDGLDVILGLQGGQGGEHDGAVASAVLLVHLADTCRGWTRKTSGLRPLSDAGWGRGPEDQATSLPSD